MTLFSFYYYNYDDDDDNDDDDDDEYYPWGFPSLHDYHDYPGSAFHHDYLSSLACLSFYHVVGIYLSCSPVGDDDTWN